MENCQESYLKTVAHAFYIAKEEEKELLIMEVLSRDSTYLIDEVSSFNNNKKIQNPVTQ